MMLGSPLDLSADLTCNSRAPSVRTYNKARNDLSMLAIDNKRDFWRAAWDHHDIFNLSKQYCSCGLRRLIECLTDSRMTKGQRSTDLGQQPTQIDSALSGTVC